MISLAGVVSRLHIKDMQVKKKKNTLHTDRRQQVACFLGVFVGLTKAAHSNEERKWYSNEAFECVSGLFAPLFFFVFCFFLPPTNNLYARQWGCKFKMNFNTT